MLALLMMKVKGQPHDNGILLKVYTTKSDLRHMRLLNVSESQRLRVFCECFQGLKFHFRALEDEDGYKKDFSNE